MCSLPTRETGGITPPQLKYGTEDAARFTLPTDLPSYMRADKFLALSDQDIRTIREISQARQEEIAQKRGFDPKTQIPKYEPGDLVLWNPREKPTDFLETKLSPNFKGPNEVMKHVKNDVTCRHLNLGTVSVFHVTRLKPFFGSREDALRMARIDNDQFIIIKIVGFVGNPWKRSSLGFLVEFEDGDTPLLPFSPDLMLTGPMEAFVVSTPSLWPLRFKTGTEALRERTAYNKLGQKFL